MWWRWQCRLGGCPGDFHYRGRRGFLCLARWFVWRKEYKGGRECNYAAKMMQLCGTKSSITEAGQELLESISGVFLPGRTRLAFTGPVRSSRFRRTDPPASEKAAARCARRCLNNIVPIKAPAARQKSSDRPELLSTAINTPAEVWVKYLWSRSYKCGSSPSHCTTCSYFT